MDARECRQQKQLIDVRIRRVPASFFGNEKTEVRFGPEVSLMNGALAGQEPNALAARVTYAPRLGSTATSEGSRRRSRPALMLNESEAVCRFLLGSTRRVVTHPAGQSKCHRCHVPVVLD